MSYNVGVSLDAYHEHLAADIGKTSTSGAEWWNVVTDPAWLNSPYCAAGLQAGLVELGARKVPASAPFYCPSLEAFARSNGIWISAAIGKGRRGDWVLFDWGLDGVADHVGFVEYDSGDWVRTIEYNTSSGMYGSQSDGRGVWRRTRERRTIKGFIRLSYSSSTVQDAPVYDNGITTLKVGSTGDRVRLLQRTMNTWFPGYPYVPLTVDGAFGAKCEAAVKQYQKNRGLSVDGRFGLNTRADFYKVTGVLV